MAILYPLDTLQIANSSSVDNYTGGTIYSTDFDSDDTAYRRSANYKDKKLLVYKYIDIPKSLMKKIREFARDNAGEEIDIFDVEDEIRRKVVMPNPSESLAIVRESQTPVDKNSFLKCGGVLDEWNNSAFYDIDTELQPQETPYSITLSFIEL